MNQEHLKHREILEQVQQYYTKKVAEYGPTYRGVDWNSAESQNLRFDKLLQIMGNECDCSIIDYGCGYGAMARYMREHGFKGQYFGFDISETMIEKAREQQSKLLDCTFIRDDASLAVVDYTLASGIFNVKQKVPSEEWRAYVLDTIQVIAEHSRKGFSFNMLTSYSDPEKMRPDLFYGDPSFFIDHCIQTYSRHVAILHNYGLYEFTILVRLKQT